MVLGVDAVGSPLSNGLIQKVFECFLQRECEKAACDTFRHLGLTEKELVQSVLESDEYNGNFRFCCEREEPRYFHDYLGAPSLSEHPLASQPRGNAWHVLHSYFCSEPDLIFDYYLAPEQVRPEDIDMCKRIIVAYRLADAAGASALPKIYVGRGVWQVVESQHQQAVIRLLRLGDPNLLAAYLVNCMRTSASYGLMSIGHLQSDKIIDILKSSGMRRKELTLLYKDRFVRLAEYLGVLPVENPEQGQYGENIHANMDDLIAKIEYRLGVPFDRPKGSGSFGVEVNGRLFDSKSAEDAYLAHRVVSLGAKSVLELGGGMGGAAFQLIRYGVSTTIFDLPVINVLQAMFLSRLICPSKICLYGEDSVSKGVSIQPWHQFFRRREKYDIVINRDSMAEFTTEMANSYLRSMKIHKERYLSINQEVENFSGDANVNQINVSLIAMSQGFERNYRFPYWMRKGYVEELFYALDI